MKIETLKDSLWTVRTAHSTEHILADTASQAIEVYYALLQDQEDETMDQPDDMRSEFPVTAVARITTEVRCIVRQCPRMRAV